MAKSKLPINADVDVLRVHIDSEEEAEAHLLRWIVSEEMKLEQEAAATGKTVTKMLAVEAEGREILRITLTCEPGKFAQRTVEKVCDLPE